MATIKPFKGVRPPKEFVEEVESRPYDVLDSEEARECKTTTSIITSTPRPWATKRNMAWWLERLCRII